MKKVNFFLDKFVLQNLLYFLLIQIIFIIIIIYFAGGGHGTGIPAVIFYSFLLIIGSFVKFGFTIQVQLLILFICLILLFVLALFFLNTRLLKIILITHVISATVMIIYAELNSSSHFPYDLKIVALIISIIVDALFWKIIFGVMEYKNIIPQKNQHKNNKFNSN